MIRRNLDAIAVALVCFGMALVSHIPPPSTATAKVIRLESAVMHKRCTLLDGLLSSLP